MLHVLDIVSNCDFFSLSLFLSTPSYCRYTTASSTSNKKITHKILLLAFAKIFRQTTYLQRCLEELEVLDKVSRLSVDPFQHNRRLSETTLLDLSSPHGGNGNGGRNGGRGLHNLGRRGTDDGSQSRSESHSVAQSPPMPHPQSLLNNSIDSTDNPFQNDQLPVWQGGGHHAPHVGGAHGGASSSARPPKPKAFVARATTTPNTLSTSSSPDNNYGGQGRAYCYQNLNETPTSPDLVNHRQKFLMQTPPSSPGSAAEVIQVHNFVKYVIKGRNSIINFFVIFQPGLSDWQKQKMQQKMDKEIVEKRDKNLTVFKKSSLDHANDDDENKSSVIPMDLASNSSKIRDLKQDHDTKNVTDAKSDSSEEDDDDEDEMNAESLKKLPGEVVEVELMRNDYGFGLALSGHSNRNRMGTYICGIHPQGSAAENGLFRVGDELIKVNCNFVDFLPLFLSNFFLKLRT